MPTAKLFDRRTSCAPTVGSSGHFGRYPGEAPDERPCRGVLSLHGVRPGRTKGAGTSFRRSWTKVDAVVRYADAIATAGQLGAILAAMQEREARRTLLKVQLVKLGCRADIVSLDAQRRPTP